MVPEVATRQGARLAPLGAPLTLVSPCKAVDALLWPQESYFLEKYLGEGFNPIGVTDLWI